MRYWTEGCICSCDFGASLRVARTDAGGRQSYRDIVGMLAKLIDAELSKATVIYNFDHGDEFEVAMCHVLRSALPARYGVCRGHIVTINDEHAGDDIIISYRD